MLCDIISCHLMSCHEKLNKIYIQENKTHIILAITIDPKQAHHFCRAVKVRQSQTKFNKFKKVEQIQTEFDKVIHSLNL